MGPTPARSDRSPATSVEPLFVLKENRLAHTALCRLAAAANGAPVWLVYLYGPSGIGKSHLIRHFVREARRAAPRLNIVEATASAIAAELDEASGRDEQAECERRFSDAELLVIEDIAAIEGKLAAQRLLIAVLDEIKRAGGRVVVTSSRLPGQLKHVQSRLADRLRGGFCAPLEPLGEAGRLSFAKHLTASRQVPLSADAIEALAKEGPPTPRELAGIILNLGVGTKSRGREIDAATLRMRLEAERGPAERPLPRIARHIARHFSIPVSQLRSTSRRQRALVPRQVAMLLARELSGEPAGAIARYFGRKNHTTVVHACRRTRALLAADPVLAGEVERLRRELRVGAGCNRRV